MGWESAEQLLNLNRIKLHISIEDQYTLSTQVLKSLYRTGKSAILFSVLLASIVIKELTQRRGLRKCWAGAKSQQDQAPHLHWGAIHALQPGLTVSQSTSPGKSAILFSVLPHCSKNPIYIFLFWELRGLNPSFHIHVSVSILYIPRIGPHIWLQQNRKTDPRNI